MTEITEVRIRKILAPDDKVRALISIVLNGDMAIHDIRIVQSNGKRFVAMPSRKDENGIYRDILHPIGKDLRDKMERQILDEYDRYMAMADID